MYRKSSPKEEERNFSMAKGLQCEKWAKFVYCILIFIVYNLGKSLETSEFRIREVQAKNVCCRIPYRWMMYTEK